MNHFLGAAAVALMIVAASSSAAAQDVPPGQEQGSFVPGLIKDVLLDPTTYAPAIVAWKATRLDWDSSQVFFENGAVEHNSRFTASGRADDFAMSYGAGNRQILSDAVTNLQMSLVNNISTRVIERMLMPRYPNHRKLLRTLGWIERSVVASYSAYVLSGQHFRQWKNNERLARELGY